MERMKRMKRVGKLLAGILLAACFVMTAACQRAVSDPGPGENTEEPVEEVGLITVGRDIRHYRKSA